MRIFVNFYLGLHFPGHLLWKLDDQAYCDQLVKTLWKSVEWCRRYSTVFSVFPDDTFSTWKVETKLCGNPRSCRISLVKFEYLDHNFTNNSRIVWTVFEKTDYVFFTSPEKFWNGSKIFGEKYILVLSPLTGLKILEIVWLSLAVCEIRWVNRSKKEE